MSWHLNRLFLLIKTITLILSCGGHIISTAHSQPHDTLSLNIKHITIASEPDYPPYCIVDKNGNADGFSVDLFKAAAKVVGIEAEIKIGVWDQIKEDLAEGRIDALPLVGRTPEREELYGFTMPYLRLHGTFFIHKNTKGIVSIEDLYDRTIAVMKGDNAEEYIRRKGLFKSIETTHTFEEAFRLLNSKEVDAIIVQKVVGLEIIKNMNLKDIIPSNIIISDFRQDFCFAVKKGNTALLDKLNEGLSIVIANKTFDELHFKWFGPTFKEKLSVKDILNIGIKIIIPLTIVLSIILIIVLRRLVKSRTRSLKQEVIEHQKTNLLLEKMEKVSKIGGWDYNIKTKIISWTKGVYEIHGVSPEEFDPSSKDVDIKFYHPDDQEILDLAFQQLLATGESYDLELLFTDAKGLQKWVWTSGQAEYQNGDIVRVFGSLMDVTESKVAELIVQESELKMREIFNSTNEAIIIHDATTGKIVECNNRAPDTFRYTAKDEMIGLSLSNIILNEYPYNEEEALKKINDTIEKGAQTFEWIGKKKNGESFWVEVSLRYIELNNQKRILSVVRDTSERKRIEAALYEQEEIFRHFMENSPVYVFFKDENIRTIRLSKNYEKMLGRPLNKLLGRTMDDLFPSDLAKNMIADDKKILREGKTITVDEEFNRRHYTTIKFTITIDGKPRYLAGYTIDITDRKKAEEELISIKNNLEKIVEERTLELKNQVQKLDKSQKAMLYMVEDLNSLTTELKREREKLQASNKELEAFSYSVSHDLRAPLRAVDGFSRLLLEDYKNILDDEGLRLLNIVRENVQKMDKLITDLLALSRVARAEMNLSKIDMTGMAKSMYHEVLENKDESHISISIDPLPEIFADTTLMRQVWQNLIGNALKYSKPKGKIVIEIAGKTEKGENIYSIKDNGVGFNPEYKHKIFDTFQRLHRADEFEGTGVGLSIVQRIISRHGGRVWADGKEGEGATFWFSLPNQ
jgi:PAS domain S-box-containing protein